MDKATPDSVMALATDLWHADGGEPFRIKRNELRAEVERLAAQSAPLQQAEPPRPHTTANIEALCKTRAAAQVEPVRMLTEREIYEALVPSINDVPRISMFDAHRAVQRAFCRVNRGKRIPADGEVRG